MYEDGELEVKLGRCASTSPRGAWQNSSDLGISNKQQLFTNGEHIDRAFMRDKVLSFDVGFILVYDFCILRVLHSFSCLFISIQHFVSGLAIVAASATSFLLYTVPTDNLESPKKAREAQVLPWKYQPCPQFFP